MFQLSTANNVFSGSKFGMGRYSGWMATHGRGVNKYYESNNHLTGDYCVIYVMRLSLGLDRQAFLWSCASVHPIFWNAISAKDIWRLFD